MNVTEITKRIEALPERMRPFYMARLEGLSKRAHSPEAEAAFLRRLEVAEDLSAPLRTTPAMRLRRGRQ